MAFTSIEGQEGFEGLSVILAARVFIRLGIVISACGSDVFRVGSPSGLFKAEGAGTYGWAGALIRSDADGRMGVGLRIGLAGIAGFAPSSDPLVEGEVAERCFSSRSSTSLAAGAMEVSSLAEKSDAGDNGGAFELCNSSFKSCTVSNLAGDFAAARVAAIYDGDCCREATGTGSVFGAYEGLVLKAASLPAARDCWPAIPRDARLLFVTGLDPALSAAASAPLIPLGALPSDLPDGDGED